MRHPFSHCLSALWFDAKVARSFNYANQSAFNRPTCFQRLIMVDRTSFDAHKLITFHSATKARLYRDSVLRWTAATREQGEQDISRARTPGRHVLLLLRTPQKGRRKSTRSRHWINEKSIIRRLTSILEARCWTLTVKHLDAETTTLREQVRDFAHSDIIISQHGAQLTNLVFLRDEGAVIESFSCRHRIIHILPCQRIGSCLRLN